MKAEELRSKKPGDIILSPSGIIPFTITEIIDGHVWGNFDKSFLPGECCRICGYMRRKDKQNKPCTGPKKITLRNKQQTSRKEQKCCQSQNTK